MKVTFEGDKVSDNTLIAVYEHGGNLIGTIYGSNDGGWFMSYDLEKSLGLSANGYLRWDNLEDVRKVVVAMTASK